MDFGLKFPINWGHSTKVVVLTGTFYAFQVSTRRHEDEFIAVKNHENDNRWQYYPQVDQRDNESYGKYVQKDLEKDTFNVDDSRVRL